MLSRAFLDDSVYAEENSSQVVRSPFCKYNHSLIIAVRNV